MNLDVGNILFYHKAKNEIWEGIAEMMSKNKEKEKKKFFTREISQPNSRQLFNGRTAVEQQVEERIWAEELNKKELEHDTAAVELRKIAGEVRNSTWASWEL